MDDTLKALAEFREQIDRQVREIQERWRLVEDQFTAAIERKETVGRWSQDCVNRWEKRIARTEMFLAEQTDRLGRPAGKLET